MVFENAQFSRRTEAGGAPRLKRLGADQQLTRVDLKSGTCSWAWKLFSLKLWNVTGCTYQDWVCHSQPLLPFVVSVGLRSGMRSRNEAYGGAEFTGMRS